MIREFDALKPLPVTQICYGPHGNQTRVLVFFYYRDSPRERVVMQLDGCFRPVTNGRLVRSAAQPPGPTIESTVLRLTNCVAPRRRNPFGPICR
jgi:hypothetical protein